MEQQDYDRLVEPHRAELRAHCYRMLGSAQDAEDALQEAMLRAWRGLAKFEGRSSLRSWLYRIATNVCLKMLERRPKLVLPVDYGPPSDPHDPPAAPLVESVWVEPFPDERLGLGDALAGPEARYDQRESVELAFIAALQHLPARQRAVLILRDVLGFSAREVAATLDATPASIDTALQRAHKNVDERLPARSQQATLRALGDRRLARDRRPVRRRVGARRRRRGRRAARRGRPADDAADPHVVPGPRRDRGVPRDPAAVGRRAGAPAGDPGERPARVRPLHVGRRAGRLRGQRHRRPDHGRRGRSARSRPSSSPTRSSSASGCPRRSRRRRRRSSHHGRSGSAGEQLLAAVDVVRRAGQRRVGHEVDREGGDVRGADDAADRERRPELLAALVELIAQDRRRQGRVDEARRDDVDADRRELEGEVRDERAAARQ